MMQKSKRFTTQKSFNSQSLYERQPSPPLASYHCQFTTAQETTALPTEAASSAKGVYHGNVSQDLTARAHHHRFQLPSTALGIGCSLSKETVQLPTLLLIPFPHALMQRQICTCKYRLERLHCPSPPRLVCETGAVCPGGITVPQNGDKQT